MFHGQTEMNVNITKDDRIIFKFTLLTEYKRVKGIMT